MALHHAGNKLPGNESADCIYNQGQKFVLSVLVSSQGQ